MKRQLMLAVIGAALTLSVNAQDTMNKKMDNKTDKMVRKMDNKTDKMNKKMENKTQKVEERGEKIDRKKADTSMRRSRPTSGAPRQ